MTKTMLGIQQPVNIMIPSASAKEVKNAREKARTVFLEHARAGGWSTNTDGLDQAINAFIFSIHEADEEKEAYRQFT